MTKHHLTTFFRNFNKAIRTFTHSDNWLIAVLQNSVKPHQQKHSGARVWVWLCWETSKADKNSNMSDKQFLEYWRSLKVSVRSKWQQGQLLYLCLLPPLKIEKMMSKGKIPKNCHLLWMFYCKYTIYPAIDRCASSSL